MFEPGGHRIPANRNLDLARLNLADRILQFPDFVVPPLVNQLASFAEQRAGVCQDFAHLLVALVRSWGFAARYVMGYVEGSTMPEEAPREQATHAWAEVLIPGAGWRGFDATSGLVANDCYVPVAVGRDSRDAAPVRGTFKGDEASASPQVSVRVQRAEQECAAQ
jgi:transglutaminase-like putative cysteine protease